MSKIIGVGTDIVEVGRVLKSCEKHSFLNKYYTEAERELIKRRKSCAATNFAGKEAVTKAFGTGFLNCMPEDIEILRDEKGKPYVNLSEKAEKIVKEKGYDISQIHIDCGIEIFDPQKQGTHAGGSGCGCSAVVFSSYIIDNVRDGKWKRILFIPTGALLSTVSYNEGQSVPGIAHGVIVEHV